MGRGRGRHGEEAAAQARSAAPAVSGAASFFKAWVSLTYLSGRRLRLGVPVAPNLPGAAAASPRGRSIPLDLVTRPEVPQAVPILPTQFSQLDGADVPLMVTKDALDGASVHTSIKANRPKDRLASWIKRGARGSALVLTPVPSGARRSRDASQLSGGLGDPTKLPARLLALLLLAFFLSLVGASSAFASAEGTPAWRIRPEAIPTNVAPGGTGLLELHIENIGDAPSAAGTPTTVVDHLPQGMIATQAAAVRAESIVLEPAGLWAQCEISEGGHTVTCVYQAGATVAPFAITPDGSGDYPGGDLEPASDNHHMAPPVGIEVQAEPLASGMLVDTATISGGGAPAEASASTPVEVNSGLAPFGVTSLNQSSTNRDGTPATQAGSHPYETASTLTFASLPPFGGESDEVDRARDVSVELPQGFVGNLTVVPRCSRADFDAHVNLNPELQTPDCPSDTQVGTATVSLSSNLTSQLAVYNLVPPAGIPAQFGAAFSKFVGLLNAQVRPTAGGLYSVVVTARDIATGGVTAVNVSLWGVPADPSHNALRLAPLESEPHPGNDVPSDVASRAFLREPTSCGTPQMLSASAVSWESPLATSPFPGASTDAQGNPIALAGCAKLDFSPSIKLTPETSATDTPTGLEANLRLPQDEDPNGLAEADLKSAVVTLPPGFTLSPSAANGLEACTPAQIGIGSIYEREAPPACPPASKLGTLEVTTPLLPQPLHGEIYLASQESVEGALFAGYLVVDDSLTGVLIKLPGRFELGGQAGVKGLQPGQVRAIFQNSPQFPFSDLKLKFFGGPHASLVTPQSCGSAAAAAEVTGWNGTVAFPNSNSLTTDTGCTKTFSPSFVAGMSSAQAGAFAPFTLNLSRSDSEQQLLDLTAVLPPGLQAKLAGVPECSDADANAGTCPESSLLGTVDIASGPGPEPVHVHGTMYLTGPYRGGPFGEVVEVPAIAGPFDLDENGKPVVVRGSIRVDPVTAQGLVVSDPFPTELRGVQLDERSVEVDIDRPGFMFNPTSCGALSTTASVSSTQSAVANVSSPFKATGCSKLPFKPAFSISTESRATKRDGAALTVKLSEKPGEANIHKVDLQFPTALPSRDTTLQQACTEQQFAKNPAGCPKGSVIGIAKAVTPVLSVPLVGPAILVSHGGASFPDVEVVLQGQGVTIVLDGKTEIKKGITYSRFDTVPDAPVTSFETRFPTGPYSIFGAYIKKSPNASLCGTALKIPTILEGQNGSVLKETLKIGVTGCPKPHGTKKEAKASKHSKRRQTISTRRAGR
jgi:hypothetical protein